MKAYEIKEKKIDEKKRRGETRRTHDCLVISGFDRLTSISSLVNVSDKTGNQ